MAMFIWKTICQLSVEMYFWKLSHQPTVIVSFTTVSSSMSRALAQVRKKGESKQLAVHMENTFVWKNENMKDWMSESVNVGKCEIFGRAHGDTPLPPWTGCSSRDKRWAGDDVPPGCTDLDRRCAGGGEPQRSLGDRLLLLLQLACQLLMAARPLPFQWAGHSQPSDQLSCWASACPAPMHS